MNGIDEKFMDLKSAGKKALIPFFTAGYPSCSDTVDIVKKAEKSGADIVELGMPFSDPVADGPIIQYSSLKALEAGVNTDSIFKICKELSLRIKIPYLLMGYYNPIYRYGLKRFANRCADTGVSGIIVPDLPYEESSELKGLLKERDIRMIRFVTPFTSHERAKKVLVDAEGFIYFVTVAGVTGPRGSFAEGLAEKIAQVKGISGIPVAAGFGISGLKQLRQAGEHVEGVIVGSHFAKKIIDGKTDSLWREIRSFKKALN